MKTISHFIREVLLNRLGITEANKINGTPTLESLKRTEWSDEFEKLMREGLVMGALRYGKLGAPNKPQYDRIPDMIRRLKQYQSDGNLEHLRDVANIALCEFVEGVHPKKHLKQIDDGEHVKKYD